MINALTSWSAFLMLLFIVISELYCKVNEVGFIHWFSLQPFLEVAGNAFGKPALAAICEAVWLCVRHRLCRENLLLLLGVCASSEIFKQLLGSVS